MKVAIALLLTVCASLHRAHTEAGENFPLGIVKGPISQVVSAVQGDVTFSCRVKGDDIEWMVNNKTANYKRNQELLRSGITFDKSAKVNGTQNSTITLPATATFNSTTLKCVALNGSGTLLSSEAVMTIAGPPLPPHPQLSVISATELGVAWDEPFTWDGFHILDYTITVCNTSEPATYPPHSFTVTQPSKHMSIENEMTNCSILTFHVTARNVIGNSTNGSISGGFPVVPKELSSAPESSVRFISDGTPEVKISFKPPEVCSFQRASYQVKVYSTTSGDLVHEGKLQMIDNSEKVVEAEITTQLAANAHYLAVISYETQFTRISANTSFSTAFHPTAPATIDEDNVNVKSTTGKTQTSVGNDSPNLAAIISSAVLGLVIAATITLLLIIAVVCVLRKRLNQRSGEREKENTMVDNPLYEGPIYESMPENKKRKLLLPKSKVNVQESLYLDSPTQSLPRDCVAAYDTLGVIVRVNPTAEDKHHNGPAKGVCASSELESSLDRPSRPQGAYQNTMLEPAVEDAYTIMSPAVPATNGIITCHTNYQATSNGDIVSGRYVMGTSTPYSSSLQKQITLV